MNEVRGSSMLQKKNRIDSLQTLRAVGFLEIFLGHCGVSFFTGAFGVSMFVVLSGFCVAINYLPKIQEQDVSILGNAKFAISKIKKLYLLHLIMLAFKYVFSNMPTSGNAFRRLFMDIFLVQCWSPYIEDFFSYNGVAWYLSTYLFICFFAPWLIKMLAGVKKKETAAALAAVTFGIMLIVGVLATKRPLAIGDSFPYWLTYIFPFYRLMDFFLGAVLGWFYLNVTKGMEWKHWKATILEILTVAAFIVVVKIFHRIEGVYDGICYNVLFVPVSMWLVIIFVHSKGMLMKLIDNRFFRWIGNLSSYTFLIHQVVQHRIMRELNGHFEGTTYLIILLVSCFIISMAGAQLASLAANRKTIKNKIAVNS